MVDPGRELKFHGGPLTGALLDIMMAKIRSGFLDNDGAFRYEGQQKRFLRGICVALCDQSYG